MDRQASVAIDAHQHFWWDPSIEDYPWMSGSLAPIRRTFGPGDLAPLLAASAIDHTVLVQTRSSLQETRAFLGLATQTEFIAGVVGWVDLTDPEIERTLLALRQGIGGQYLVGIRHQVHDEPDPDWLLREDVLRGLQAVHESDLAYDLLVRRRELPAALLVAGRFPTMRLVIDHIAKPAISTGEIDDWASALSPFSKRENVYCKLSGMVTEADWSGWTPADLAPYVDEVRRIFGDERLMFGSDWPVCLLAARYTDVVESVHSLIRELPLVAQRGILGANAVRFYRLDRTIGRAAAKV